LLRSHDRTFLLCVVPDLIRDPFAESYALEMDPGSEPGVTRNRKRDAL